VCPWYADDMGTFFFILAILAFVGIWIYAFAAWGFLIGLTIGWLPATVGAVVLLFVSQLFGES